MAKYWRFWYWCFLRQQQFQMTYYYHQTTNADTTSHLMTTSLVESQIKAVYCETKSLHVPSYLSIPQFQKMHISYIIIIAHVTRQTTARHAWWHDIYADTHRKQPFSLDWNVVYWGNPGVLSGITSMLCAIFTLLHKLLTGTHFPHCNAPVIA